MNTACGGGSRFGVQFRRMGCQPVTRGLRTKFIPQREGKRQAAQSSLVQAFRRVPVAGIQMRNPADDSNSGGSRCETCRASGLKRLKPDVPAPHTWRGLEPRPTLDEKTRLFKKSRVSDGAIGSTDARSGSQTRHSL